MFDVINSHYIIIFMAERNIINENAMATGDLNGDGRVNAKDQLMLRKMLAGV